MVKRVVPALLVLAGIAAAGVRVANPKLLSELSAAEQAVLAKQGMVARPTSAEQMYDIYTDAADSKLPILVTTDPMLHVFHILYDYSLRTAELDYFYPEMERVLDGLLKYEQARYAETNNPVVKQALLGNVAYLSVPLSYLRSDFQAPEPVAGLVKTERALIDSGTSDSSVVMGYEEDFTQYKPRGHYTRNESFRRYFKAMMYLGRMTFRLPLAGDTTLALNLTRRAILLAEALETAQLDSGPSPKDLWRQVYDVTTYLVGKSDDIMPEQYYATARRLAGSQPLSDWVVPDTNLIRFFAAAGRELPQPRILGDMVKTTGIPAGMRLMGQRYIPDSQVFDDLTFDRIPGRTLPMGLDVMAVLGSERARSYLIDLYHQDRYAGYLAKLDSMKAVFAGLDSTRWNQSAYYSWLYTLKLNLEPVKATNRKSLLAGFVRSVAYPDKTLVSTCASWTQLRHDTILYAKMTAISIGLGGHGPGKPPDDIAYVEPKPALFRQLARQAVELRRELGKLGSLNTEVDHQLLGFASAAARLESIVDGELHGDDMSATDATFCRGIGRLQQGLVTFSREFSDRYARGADVRIESHVGYSVSKTDDEDRKMALVADVATDPNAGLALEEAVGDPCKVYAVIPFYGEQYLAVGACFSYYEFTKPMTGRMTDAEWQALSPKPPMPEWTKSFVVTP